MKLLKRVTSKIDAGLCWEWTDAPSQYGYGRLRVGGRAGKLWLAHRLVWTLLVGPIPEGMTLDHLCRNRLCVNPDHLELVTLAENKRRGFGPFAVNARKHRWATADTSSPQDRTARVVAVEPATAPRQQSAMRDDG